jgi:hypothetical protein
VCAKSFDLSGPEASFGREPVKKAAFFVFCCSKNRADFFRSEEARLLTEYPRQFRFMGNIVDVMLGQRRAEDQSQRDPEVSGCLWLVSLGS